MAICSVEEMSLVASLCKVYLPVLNEARNGALRYSFMMLIFLAAKTENMYVAFLNAVSRRI